MTKLEIVVVSIVTFLAFTEIGFYAHHFTSQRAEPTDSSVERFESIEQSSPTPTPAPPTATTKPTSKPTAKPTSADWGKATKNEDGTYTMNVGMDAVMTSPNELYEALNNYRQTKGRSRLGYDGKLAEYAQTRASYICTNGGDGHAGFYNFINNQGGYDILGYAHLGENLSYNMRMSGVHLVEWIYSQSPSHEANQLGVWDNVGVGISGNCSVVIFGGSKL